MRKNLVAMLLAVGVIATATGCGSTESTSTTGTTEYVTDEVATEEAQVEETTEYVEEATEEVVEETAEDIKAEDINVDELVAKSKEAVEAAEYVKHMLKQEDIINSTTSEYFVYLDLINNKYALYSNAGDTVYADLNTDTEYAQLAGSSEWAPYTGDMVVDNAIKNAKNNDLFERYDLGYSFVVEEVNDNTAKLASKSEVDVNGIIYEVEAIVDLNTSLPISASITTINESGEAVNTSNSTFSYPTEGTPEYDEFIQKTTIPAEAIEAANNQ